MVASHQLWRRSWRVGRPHHFTIRAAFNGLRLESRCLLAIGLFFGFLAVTFIPPIVTFDGPSHFFRADEISRGRFRSIRYSERHLGGPVPGRYARFVQTLWSGYWPAHNFRTLSQWSAITRVKYGDTNPRVEGWTNTAVYSPANYIPQSLGMALSHGISRSPLWAHRAACTFNLLVFLALLVWALEILPRGQMILLLIASSPFVLIQAATVNIDGTNFAVPVCLFALVWKVRSCPSTGNHYLVALTCLALWMSLLKPPNIVCLGFLLFVPTAYFKSRIRKTAWLTAMLAVAFVLWNVWNAPYFDVNVNGWFDPTHPPVREQKAWLIHHPADFFASFKNFLTQSFPHQWSNFYSGLGDWAPQGAVHLLESLSYGLLAVVLVLPIQGQSRDRSWAAITLGICTAMIFVMSLALWIISGIRYTGWIPFLGGRYLFLFYFLTLVSWSELVGFRSVNAGRVLMKIGLATNTTAVACVLIPEACAVWG